MRSKKVVTVIPEKRPGIRKDYEFQVKKRRVAGYARVSTELEQQQNSYQTQLDYYTAYISSRPDWEFVGMYSDEGVTGTSTKKRDGFNRMVEDALNGKIDLIVTKSVSRFARNTVDSLSTVRKLKAAGVEIYFEKENIFTMDQKGELMITIMSSLAQEESRSISENTTWGQRKRMADGHGCVGFSQFMGYDRGPEGEFVINEEQAKIVRRIFNEYLGGKNTAQIAKGLTADGIKTVTGRDKWNISTILSMLKNEKYKGDCLMQKFYIDNFLTKKLVKNKGELQQYYVKDHHDPIVSEEVFDAVQKKLKHSSKKKKQSGARDFSSLIVCGDCGAFYGSKVWHSNDKYKKVIYRCNAKYDGEKCKTPAVDEERLKELYVDAMNVLIEDKDDIIENLKVMLEMKSDDEGFATALRTAALELQKAEDDYRAIIDKQKISPVDFEEYEKQIKVAGVQYDEAKECYELLIEKNRTRTREAYEVERFIEGFEALDGIVFEYDYDLMMRTVSRIKAFEDKSIVFEFICGTEIELEI